MLMKFWALQQAKREKRRYEFKSIKLGHKLPRIEKQITNIQKIYQKKQTQLESQSKMYQANMEQQMRAQMMGGYGSYGSFGSSMLGGMAGSIFNTLIEQGVKAFNEGGYQDKDGNAYYKDKDGNAITNISQEDLQKAMNGDTSVGSGILNVISSIKSQASQWMNYQNQIMEQNITNMKMMVEQQKEMQIAQMEEEQEAALLPLNEEQTELELEKTFVETRLTELKEEIETLKSECAEEAKDHAPKFGLA